MLPSANRLRSSIVLLFSVLILLAAAAFGQVNTGILPFSSNVNFGVDQINVENLNTHISIPIVNKPGRGMPFDYVLSYDSWIFFPVNNGSLKQWAPVQNWGWRGVTEAASGFVSWTSKSTRCPVLGEGNYKTYTNFVYHDPYGAPHSFPDSFVPVDCNGNTFTFSSSVTDGSGYSLSLSTGLAATVTSASGVVRNPPRNQTTAAATITDSNGNQITTPDGLTFTDTVGTTVLKVSGSAPNPVTYTYPTTTGSAVVTVNYQNYSILTNFGCNGIVEFGASAVPLVSSIGFNDGSSYSFQYEPTPGSSGSYTGRIQSVTLPTGGTITYSYTGSNNGIHCSDGSPAGVNRTTSDGTTQFTANGTYSTVFDPTGNERVYTFQNGYETQRQMYQGNLGTGTLLKTIITCYNGNNSNCPTQPVSPPISTRGVYVVLPGMSLRTDTLFDTTSGATTEVDEYDWGVGAAGNLAQKTVYQYAALGNNILNRPSSVTVTEGSGKQIAQTTYGYDESAVTPTSGLPQHVAVSGLRGNLTSVHRWLGATGTNVNITNTYDDAGRVLSTTDPKGNTTSFAYSCSDAYLSQVTLPKTGNIAHTTSSGYDCNTGLLTSTTDQNNQQTTFAYDNMLRQTQANYPDGGLTKTTYWSANSTSVQRLINTSNPSRMTYSASLTDGYGRPSRTAVGNDEGGFDQQDTCYASNGRVGFKSYSYQGSGWQTPQVCTGAGDSFAYDGLARTRSVTHSDGTSVQYTYSGRAAQVTDEGNNADNSTHVTRVTQSDGLGRLTGVCEVSSATQQGSGGTPASCGLDIAGTGFLTSYGYGHDVSGDLITTISQGIVSPRTFTYDSLGRLTKKVEPESGTTTYTYDANGNVASKTDARNVKTTYIYDALNRLLSRQYTDSTPTAGFLYDVSAGWNNATQTNLVGRLSQESTYAPQMNTGTVFSYDTMGRIITQYECTPVNCGTSNKAVSYSYDQVGELTSSTNGEGVTLSYGYNVALRNTSLGSSLADANHPGTLLSGVHYNAFGEMISGQVGNFASTTGQAETDGYDARGRLNHIFTYVNTPTGQVGLLGSDYGLAGNGSVISMSDGASGNWTYTYDDFNRLKSASVPTYGGVSGSYSYGYDPVGNRWSQTGASSWSQSFDANNRITGWSYDTAGNLLNDHAHAYTYDAEGRMLTADGGPGNGGTSYVYDAEGRRVARMNSAGTHGFTYDVAGNLISEYGPNSWYRGEVYAGGRHLATYSNGTIFFSSLNRIHDERVRAIQDGSGIDSCINLPFGDGKMCWGNKAWQSSPLHFADTEYDSESGLDHMGFRQYASSEGRFTSPDPFTGSMDLSNPQSLNRYAYVFNNPLNATDPLGLFIAYKPGCANWTGLCAFNIGPGSDAGGSTIDTSGVDVYGNDFFDALFGTPGTYLSFDIYGRMSWGFDEGLYFATMNFIDKARTGLPPGVSFQPGVGAFQVAVHDWGTSTETEGLIPDILAAEVEKNRITAGLNSVILPEGESLGELLARTDGRYTWIATMQWAMETSPEAANWAPYMLSYQNQLMSIEDRIQRLFYVSPNP